MGKELLNTREAVEDKLLSPIFNNAEFFSWEIHIPVMVSFWETLLLDTPSYKGNTMQKHIALHRRTPLTPALFERWKLLFYSTLDELFDGRNVAKAKKRVEAMSELMRYKIEQSEQKGFIQQRRSE